MMSTDTSFFVHKAQSGRIVTGKIRFETGAVSDVFMADDAEDAFRRLEGETEATMEASDVFFCFVHGFRPQTELTVWEQQANLDFEKHLCQQLEAREL